MNVAVVNVKDLLKYFLKLVLAIFSIFVMSSVLCLCVWSFLGGVLK